MKGAPVLVLRPIAMEDLEQLTHLATLTMFGLTTLPRDRELLRKRIEESQRSFDAAGDKPRGEAYLFVLEDLAAGAIVGTTGIVSKVGGFEPFYAYRVETSIHESQMLGVRKEIRTLHLVVDHDGPCEIGSLFLHQDYRKDGNGKLLSLARFLYMAEHRDRFDPMVIAEMRGVIDDQGRSAFWDAVGRHFFDIEFPKADYLSIVNKRFIADLMPRWPIYIPLLPPAAQAVIGQVHEHTAPALHILENEGLQFCHMVDIFEAGPVVKCPLAEVRTVRESRVAAVAAITDDPIPGAGAETCLISNTARDFRATKGAVLLQEPEGVGLTSAMALALRVKLGDRVRLVAMPRRDGRRKAAAPIVQTEATKVDVADVSLRWET